MIFIYQDFFHQHFCSFIYPSNLKYFNVLLFRRTKKSFSQTKGKKYLHIAVTNSRELRNFSFSFPCPATFNIHQNLLLLPIREKNTFFFIQHIIHIVNHQIPYCNVPNFPKINEYCCAQRKSNNNKKHGFREGICFARMELVENPFARILDIPEMVLPGHLLLRNLPWGCWRKFKGGRGKGPLQKSFWRG